MLKILYYIYGLNIGGAETFIKSVIEKIDMECFHIDFVLQSTENKNVDLIDLCKKKGARIYYIPPFYKKPIGNIRKCVKIIKEGNYEIVHIHQNAVINICPIIAGKLAKVSVIMHSHNSFSNGGKIANFVHKFNRALWMSNIRHLSCGEEAGKWMYGKQSYQIINNAINLEKFGYSDKYRDEIRDKYSIGKDNVVVGHVGRFVKAKNHIFIIEVFKQFHLLFPNSYLMLVGDGELKEAIKDEITEDIYDYVIFTGNVNNIYKFYSAFDVLLFPSLFEGLPFTLVEAQASGLKCLVSTNVTTALDITNTISFFDLSEDITEWEKRLEECITNKEERMNRSLQMVGSVFDLDKMIGELEKIYILCEKGNNK